MGAKIAALLIKSITFLTMWLLSTTSLLKLPMRRFEEERKKKCETKRRGSPLYSFFLSLLRLLLFKLFFRKTQVKTDTNVK